MYNELWLASSKLNQLRNFSLSAFIKASFSAITIFVCFVLKNKYSNILTEINVFKSYSKKRVSKYESANMASVIYVPAK